MLFHSLDFAVFLPLVFGLYWGLRPWGWRAQNVLLLLAGYVFYGWWDYRFLGLIVFSSTVDYLAGLGMSRFPARRGALLIVSLVCNLGLLGVFKYFDFFATGFAEGFRLVGYAFAPWQLDYVLPVGISFYTFQTLSYTIDIYRGRIQPTRDVVAFFTFVNFFPQLVAGPVERAASLLPQFLNSRIFDYGQATAGCRQILWGLFAKMVVADHCAGLVNRIFGEYANLSGSVLLLGAFLFSVQIYADFSAYSNIAIGTAKLFGFRLMENFSRPYFATNLTDFWRRWHISMSTWFRDYVYIPLGGRGAAGAVLATFLVSGLWHGAAWTFVVWGLLHGLLYLATRRLRLGPLTFLLVTACWIVFRAPTLTDAIYYFGDIFDFENWWGRRGLENRGRVTLLAIAIPFLFGAEALNLDRRRLPWLFYALLTAAIGLFMAAEEVEFIYFNF